RIGEFFGDDFESASICLAFYAFAMTRHAYLFDAPNEWRHASTKLAMIGRMLPDGPTLVEASFFRALGLLKPGFVDESDREAGLEEVQELLDRFETWAQHGAENFQHKALLIAAELARARGEHRQAMELYAKSIEAAGESGFAHCEGLCNELYARFW